MPETMTLAAQNGLKAAIFDLDGTLIDHFTTIYRCANYALEQLGYPTVSFERVKATVGGGLPNTLKELSSEKDADEAVHLFRQHFDQIWKEDLAILPGAEFIVRGLQETDIRAAVLTNKEGSRARDIMIYLGLEDTMEVIVGEKDTPWKKPEPELSAYILNELKLDGAETCLVGDSPWDVEAARAGNMFSYSVATGSHSVEDLAATGTDATYEDMFALAHSVFGLAPPTASCP